MPTTSHIIASNMRYALPQKTLAKVFLISNFFDAVIVSNCSLCAPLFYDVRGHHCGGMFIGSHQSVCSVCWPLILI